MLNELILEKYVLNPIKVQLSGNVLECNGTVIANDAVSFDAATDSAGVVHGIFATKDGRVDYFKLANGLPQFKNISNSIAKALLSHFSVTEEDGIVHILIVKGDRFVYHYRLINGFWSKSNMLTLDDSFDYIDSCPCGNGDFAVLSENNGKLILYCESGGKWREIDCRRQTDGHSEMSISYVDGNVELLTAEQNNVKSTVLAGKTEFEKIKRNVSEENIMANGNTINSKVLAEIRQNSADIESLRNDFEQLNKRIDEMLRSFDDNDRHNKMTSSIKELLKGHDTQINQLSIRIQELTNRFNGFSKAKNQQQ